MNTRKIIVLASIVLALFMIAPVMQAHAQGCYYCNPLLFPFAVVGAAVGTAAAIVTAPFCPYCGPAYVPPPPPGPVYYYPPDPPPIRHRMWIRGYYNVYGAWVPGHWLYR